MKDVNRFMVAILGALDGAEVAQVGDVVEAYLAKQDSDSRAWPTDAEVMAGLPKVKLYGNVRQSRLRVVLEALEKQLRSGLNEDVSLPSGLQVEHLMPQGWRTYWDTDPKLSPAAAAERDRLVNTIGNLTLVTSTLNGTLSNRPWTDGETAALVKAAGDLKGVGKRSLVSKFSLLALSRGVVENRPDTWTETDIKNRSEQLAHALCQVWLGPPALATLTV
ncbi:HNH endonuclease family protein [Blastococcus aurantiacus]|uniref:HNH endonuclease family protein n=1 Tax=Blastococcus aurantiacus TaxID=1550231 RepID=UPI000AAC18D7|nr:HNH endonuclease family protein [Blastococcus aurantiacus]